MLFKLFEIPPPPDPGSSEADWDAWRSTYRYKFNTWREEQGYILDGETLWVLFVIWAYCMFWYCVYRVLKFFWNLFT